MSFYVWGIPVFVGEPDEPDIDAALAGLREVDEEEAWREQRERETKKGDTPCT